MSIPGLGRCTKSFNVTVKGQDRDGNPIMTGSDLLARCILHEVDHLNGVLYTDLRKRIPHDEEEEEKSEHNIHGYTGFCCTLLQMILEEGYTVLAVVTQPDRPKGRKRILTPSPVKEEA